MASRNRRNRRRAQAAGAATPNATLEGPTQVEPKSRATADYQTVKAPRSGRPDPVVAADLPSLLSGGRAATADARLDYLAGGGGVFPLAGQTILAKPGDDLSRDLGQQIYETMLYDPTVWSAMLLLWTMVLGGELQLVPAFKEEPGEASDPNSEQGQKIARAKYWADFCEQNLDRIDRPFKQVLWDLGVFGFTYGTKIAEKVCEPGEGDYDGMLVLKAIKVKPNSAWNYVVDPYGDIVAVRGLIYGGGLADLPPEKFVIFTWMSRDRDPRGRSGLRSAYNGWNLKINGWPKYYTYIDLFANPIPVGITAENATDEPARDDSGNVISGTFTPTQALSWALSRIGNGRCLAVRAGTQIIIVQAQGDGEAFDNYFDRCDREILKGMLTSPRGTMEAEHGSKADSETASGNIQGVAQYGREMISTLVRDQLCHWLIELNAGKDEADEYCPEVDMGQVGQNDIAQAGTGLAALGYAVDQTQWPALDARYGLKVRNIQDLAIQALQEEGSATVASAPGGVAPGEAAEGAAGHDEGEPTASPQITKAGLRPNPKGFERTSGSKRAPLPKSPTKQDLASVGVAGSTAGFREEGGDDSIDPFALPALSSWH